MFGFPPHLLSGDFRYTHSLFPAAGATQQIAPANPDRWCLLFWLPVGNTILVAPDALPDNQSGVAIATLGTLFVLNFAHIGPLICGVWLNINGSVSQFVVTDVTYTPETIEV